jgi:carbamoyltransferase
MVILGINAYHGDASAAIVCDGRLVAAAEEERFTRVEHCAGFPTQAVRYCLKAASISPRELEIIAVARDPKTRLPQKALFALTKPRLALQRLAAHRKFTTIKDEFAAALDVDSGDLRARVLRVEHHKAHLASSFLVSGFENAALLSVDGFGDFASTMWGLGVGNQLFVDGSIAFPHSLGIYYTAITQYLGFLEYGDEYKVMGLAAFGSPEYQNEFAKILRVEPAPNGHHQSPAPAGDRQTPSFNLGLDYFVHHKNGAPMTWEEGTPKLGALYSDHLERRLGPARLEDAPLEKRHKDIAASLQTQLEAAVLSLLNRLYHRYRVKRLCLAGGVAFNCVVNGKIIDRTPFEELYVQPAAGDAGLAIGAAFYVWNHIMGGPRSFQMQHAYWGPEFGDMEISSALHVNRAEIETRGYRVLEINDAGELCRQTAGKLAAGNTVGWFQGRMEFGPRALGSRSILADPRRPEMKDILNSRIKHRETFRPFAPSVLEERCGELFEQSHRSPFMLITYKIRPEKRASIQATAHIDDSARVQTVSRSETPLYWRLIKEFDALSGVPALLNTSFNDNEPIVCRPEEALACFLRTNMDVLVMGKYLIAKE